MSGRKRALKKEWNIKNGSNHRRGEWVNSLRFWSLIKVCIKGIGRGRSVIRTRQKFIREFG